ncbi:ATP-dependent DNA helicase sgs1 [Datura stramonium]|uniref:ATP-dependent DNA helicase sgs1 n=1 Tax=Datura stramonium TaxID=4076 RepID=A0ABS8V1W3_DATST|nr:ATP-dependent DNA helicase sgs1 [Datura stramonium]
MKICLVADYLIETFKDVYKTVSVSEKGLQFLRSSSPDHQPPLFLPETPEMDLDEKNGDTPSETSEINGLASKEFEEFSQAETQLYKMLIEERIKLAKATGTAPYAVCGDQTLKRISLNRPSTKARLANIDGVNQHFIKLYGDSFLQSVKHLSKAYNLSLDGYPTSQTSVPGKTVTIPSNTKLTPAKFEAWKMWHEDGLTFKEIANFPGRAAAIKEQTVLEYILEAAREGCRMNWTRFCEETGLTREIFLSIQNAVSKVGREKLKPIKAELPEEVSYGQIKAYLMMQEAGVSAEVFSSKSEQSCNVDECLTEISEILQNSIIPSDVQGDDDVVEAPVIACINGAFSPGKTEGAESHLLTERSRKEAASSEGDLLILRKRQRVETPEGEGFRTLDATEESILSWLKNFDDGVTLYDLLEHFNGSTEKSLVDLLCYLEGEFLIYRKNNLYKLM